MARTPSQRFRISVPETDKEVLAWIDAQSNLSFSLRLLMREAMRLSGEQDISCTQFTFRNPPGRPRKKLSQPAQSEPVEQIVQPVIQQAPQPVAQPVQVQPVAEKKMLGPAHPERNHPNIPFADEGSVTEDDMLAMLSGRHR